MRTSLEQDAVERIEEAAARLGLVADISFSWPFGLIRGTGTSAQCGLSLQARDAAKKIRAVGQEESSVLETWAHLVVAMSDLEATMVELVLEDVSKSMKLGKKDARRDLLRACEARAEALDAMRRSLSGEDAEEEADAGEREFLEALKAAEAREEVLRVAQPILKDPLAALDAALTKLGRVGERKAAKAVFLATVSAYLPRGINLALKAQSSSGKSFTAKGALAVFPEEFVKVFASMSARAIIYDEEGSYVHRTIFLEEGEALARQKGEKNDVAEMLRVLLSEGRLKHATVEKGEEGKFTTRWVTQDGPTNLIVTTTRGMLDPEVETRMVSLWLDESVAQTKAVVEAIAAAAEDGAVPELGGEDRVMWDAYFQTIWTGTRDVVVPFARIVAGGMPSTEVRARRDIGTLLAFVRASAVAHRTQRELDAGGRLVAQIEDYEIALDVVGGSIAQAHELDLSDNARALLGGLKALIEPALKGAQHPNGSGSLWDDAKGRPVLVKATHPVSETRGVSVAYVYLPGSAGSESDVAVSGPSRGLAHALGISRRSLGRYLAHCEHEDLIERLDDKKAGRGKRTELRLLPAAWDALSGVDARPVDAGLPSAEDVRAAMEAREMKDLTDDAGDIF